MLSTERIILRPWKLSDAPNLYQYVCDPRVGPITGWPPYTGIEYSEEIITKVFDSEQQYAICLKETPEVAIGSIEIMEPRYPFMKVKDAEVGYWIGVPFWGKEFIPEALREILRYSFEEIGIETMWCGYYDGNQQSRIVQEKVGFTYEFTQTGIQVPLLNETRVEHFTKLTKNEWQRQNS